jgi:hypothetical protein
MCRVCRDRTNLIKGKNSSESGVHKMALQWALGWASAEDQEIEGYVAVPCWDARAGDRSFKIVAGLGDDDPWTLSVTANTVDCNSAVRTADDWEAAISGLTD